MYCIDPTAEEPIMLINTHIGFDEIDGMGVDGGLFQRELLELDALGKKRIKIYINSGGGSVIDGYAIYSAILKTRTPIDTYNVGIAASIAGVIFMAGRNRVMCDYSLLMMHLPFGSDNQKQIEAMTNSICTMLSVRANIGEQEVMKMMIDETWMRPSDALMNGFATEIEASNESNKKRLAPVTSEPKAMWRECNAILNSIFINKKTNMDKVINKLGLVSGASEETILNAIESIQNKSKEELAKMKEALDKAIEDCNNMKEAYDKMKAEHESELEKKAEEMQSAKKEEAKVKAHTLIDGFVKVGKIKNESKEAWVSKAIEDFAGTKALLEDLPVNRQAVNLVVEEVPAKEATNALNYMAMIQNKIKNKNK